MSFLHSVVSVRRFNLSFALLFACLAVLCALGWIGLSARASTQETASAPHIVPHRAIYDMSLNTVKNGGVVSDVSGRMLFEWRDMCDGWAIQQHMHLHFSYEKNAEDGGDTGAAHTQDIASTELTWESKDGKRYAFNIHHETNGQETELYRGKAEQKRDGSVVVSYEEPKGKILRLSAGTVFPSAHTELMLRNAVQNQKFFTSRVFDGSDADGVNDVSAFISPPRSVDQESSLSAELQKNVLLANAAWPVHMAFFKIKTETEQPDYEMDLEILPNGIARHMKINYGDFSVIGTLSGVEALPLQHCP